jgi:DUF2075 family protein
MHGSSSGSENSTKRVVHRNGNVFNDARELLFEGSYVLVTKGIEGVDVFSHDSKKRNQLVCKPIHIEIQTCDTTNSMPGLTG